MPKIQNEVSEKLRPYVFHGVELGAEDGSGQVTGDCPFCGREGKFRLSTKTGLWDCKVCRTGTDKGGGNIFTFFRELVKVTRDDGGLGDLRVNRRLLFEGTLRRWGVLKSPLTGEWLVSGYGADGKLNNLYRYAQPRGGSKKILQCTTGVQHQLFGLPLYDKKKPIVYLCEGVWDAMTLWEMMRNSKRLDDGTLEKTGNEETSLLSDSNILGMPGANTFKEQWGELFGGKAVVLMPHSDHPKKENGKTFDPVGYAGMRRVAQMLAVYETPPEEIRCLSWGENGYDPKRPSGSDLRDYLSPREDTPIRDRIRLLGELLEKVKPIPETWLTEINRSASKGHVGDMDCLDCFSWDVLIMAWRKAMRWSEGLDRALSVMLATILSTKALGDQLWVKIIGPASCGKSTLCEAVSINKEFIIPKSTLKGFHSAYKLDASGEEDTSLIARLYGKTLVTKDGDALLQAPNLGQILSEARDLYDRTSRSSTRNGMDRDYQGVSCTWILCGTASLREIDQSELGARFLDCVIMEGIDEELEDEILWRVVNKADRAMSFEADGTLESQHDPDLLKAMQLTGGYVNYLRQNAKALLSSVDNPDSIRRQCIQLGKFVAYMRARPSNKQDETSEREFAARLVGQLIRLAKCIAVVLNKKVIDEEVMRRVTRVAVDTARGRTLELAKFLFKSGVKGEESATLALYTAQSVEHERKLLIFLRRIGAVETFTINDKGVRSKPRWRLTERMTNLYRAVMEKVE